VVITYQQPSTGQVYSEAQTSAVRGVLTELSGATRMVAMTADDDGGSFQAGGRWGHEVYLLNARGDWKLLTPGTNLECGGATGWPSQGSESAFYLWHTSAQLSVVAGVTGISSAALDGLEVADLLPRRIGIEVRTGGGGAFGYQQRIFAVR
jgi:hypothetical protein